jgi:hypothetical protein
MAKLLQQVGKVIIGLVDWGSHRMQADVLMQGQWWREHAGLTCTYRRHQAASSCVANQVKASSSRK